MPPALLKLLLCVILVLNGIGSATAGARMAEGQPGVAATLQGVGEPVPDCPHAAASGGGEHFAPADPIPSPDHAAHEGDECLELCLEQCLNQVPAVVALLAGLQSMGGALPLAPGNDPRAPSPRPALLTRPPIA